MKKIVVLISGYGANLQAIIDACESRYIDGEAYSATKRMPLDCNAPKVRVFFTALFCVVITPITLTWIAILVMKSTISVRI